MSQACRLEPRHIYNTPNNFLRMFRNNHFKTMSEMEMYTYLAPVGFMEEATHCFAPLCPCRIPTEDQDIYLYTGLNS